MKRTRPGTTATGDQGAGAEMDTLSEADFQKARGKIRKLAKVMITIGPMLGICGIVFFISEMSGRPSIPRFFLGFGMFAGGVLMTFFGVQALVIGHAGKISRFLGRSTIPAASENIEQFSTGGRKGITNLAAAVGEGLAVSGAGTGGELTLCPGCGSTNDSAASFCDQLSNSKLFFFH